MTDPAALRLRLTDMAYGGDAVGRDPDSGVAVFAWPAIKGEEATVAISSKRHNLMRGLVADVIEPSPLRAEPPCPYFGVCGGCHWQHIQYGGQVQFKHDILRSQLARAGGIEDPDAVLKPPIGSPRDLHYRNSSHFAIDPATHTLSYFKRESHSIIPVSACPISNEGINATIPLVNSMLGQAAQDALLEEPRGVMRVWKVVIRHSIATGQTLVVFHTKPGGQAQPRPQRSSRYNRGGRGPQGGQQSEAHRTGRPDVGPGQDAEAEANPVVLLRRRDVRRAIVGLAQSTLGGETVALGAVEIMDDGTINGLGETRSASSVMVDAQAEALTGALLSSKRSERDDMRPPMGAWLERLGGRLYWVAPEAFFQVNTEAAELLLGEVSEHLPRNPRLLVDAHAGVGTFAFAFAERAAKVIGFETDGGAVASGHWTVAANNLTNVSFQLGRAEDLLPNLPASEQPDIVVLDPPRAGCHPRLLTEVARRRVPRIIYVSCDPSTLARDIKALSSNYKLISARMIDMFPQTFHLETVAVLDRVESD